MTAGMLVWIARGTIFGAVFFAIAAVVSAYGGRDLRRLLCGAERRRGENTLFGKASIQVAIPCGATLPGRGNILS